MQGDSLRLVYIYIIIVLFFVGFKSNAQDLTPPDAPIIDSVTVQWSQPVNSNGDILITWKKSDSTDVRSYYIKYLNEALGTYKFLDSVDANTHAYLDTKQVTNPHYTQTYVVQAVDSSNNTSNHSFPHKTVRIFPIQKDDNCKLKVELTWNLYEGWDEGIEYFELYSVEDNIHYYLGHFLANQQSYSYQPSGNQTHYEYYLRIKSKNGRTSTSNKIPFEPQIPKKPEFIDAQYASVEGEKVKLSFRVDNTSQINNYCLKRSIDSSDSFHEIKTINHSNQEFLDFTDSDVYVNNHQYFYKLYLFDDCDNTIDSSRILSTILLKGIINKKQYSQQLYWKKYYNGLNTDKIYQLYRFSETQPVEIINSTVNSYYLDDLRKQDVESFVGDFCYYIIVDEEEYSGNRIIKSNTVCLSQSPLVFFPDAFSPNSCIEENTIFKPSFSFISLKEYYFAIYDRFGIRIFETIDYKEGWTGKENNQTYNNGVYIYYLEYSSGKGTGYTKTGTFNLID